MKQNLSDTQNQLLESTLHSREIFKGKLLHVFKDQVKLPDETESSREWIKHPGACAILPVFRDGSIMLIRQFRYPVKQIFYEVPAGKIDPGESPVTTAIRETKEETGLKAGSIEYVGHFYPAIGYSDEIIHIYVAWDLIQLDQQSDDDEFVINVRIPFSEALSMIQNNEISDSKTISTLTKTRMWWKKFHPFPVEFNE
ncbi:MAG: NUDIX hydrolase [Balneolaceae bacterium]